MKPASLLPLFLALLLPPAPVALAQQPRFVVCNEGRPKAACVHDGDTIWFAGEKIRFLDIDAPEMGPPKCDGPAQLAVPSRDALIEILNSGRVTLHRDGKDRYGRTLARVFVDGRDVQAELMAMGLARPYVPGAAWC